MVLRALKRHGVHKLIRLRNVEARVTSGICHSSLGDFFCTCSCGTSQSHGDLEGKYWWQFGIFLIWEWKMQIVYNKDKFFIRGVDFFP